MSFCPECGFKLDKVYKFCPECGYKFGEISIKKDDLFDFSEEDLKSIDSLNDQKRETFEEIRRKKIKALDLYDEQKYASAFPILMELSLEDGQCAYYVAECYKNGYGVDKSEGKALHYFEAAKKLGYESKSITTLMEEKFLHLSKVKEQALMLYNDKKYADAFPLLLQCLSLNDAEIESCIGFCYKKGYGTTKDLNKAFSFYEKSANKFYPKGLYNLANMYYTGNGVTKNLNQAFALYEKAALQNHSSSQYNLGLMYEMGEGVEKNYSKALYWYEKAALQGNTCAQYNLGLMYENGIGINVNYTKAIYWYEKAAAQNDASAQNNLANCYYFGKGVSKDIAKAVELYKKAVANGSSAAKDNLSKIK